MLLIDNDDVQIFSHKQLATLIIMSDHRLNFQYRGSMYPVSGVMSCISTYILMLYTAYNAPQTPIYRRSW